MMKYFVLALIFGCIALALPHSVIAEESGNPDPIFDSVSFQNEKLADVLKGLNSIYNVEIKLEDDKWNETLVSVKAERAHFHTAIKKMLRAYNYALQREGQRQWLLTVYGLVGNDNHQMESRIASNAQSEHKVVRESDLQDGWVEITGGLESIREFIRNPDAQKSDSELEFTLETETEAPADEWIEQEGPNGIREFVRLPSSRLSNDVQATESSIKNGKNQDDWIELEGPDGIKEVIRRTVVKGAY